MTPEEFRQAGHRLVDFIADYRTQASRFPVMARTAPGEVRAQLPAAPPCDPEPFEAVLADLERIVLPGLSHWQHPRFFGYFPANSLLAGVLGDFASTGLGVLGLSWQSSPALTEMEEVTDRLGAPDGGPVPGVERRDSGHGVHLHVGRAAVRARARHRFRPDARRPAVAEKPAASRLHSPPTATAPYRKAALLAGFGRDNVRMVPITMPTTRCGPKRSKPPSETRSRGRPQTLRDRRHRRHHHYPRPSIQSNPSPRSRPPRVWLHVDAAMAGSAMILPECRWMWEGIEKARIRWCSTRTNGSACRSIARSTTCADPSTWCASCPPIPAICRPRRTRQ